MLDINKLIQAEHMAPCEADAWLNDLEPWTEEDARLIARDEGFDLTDAHRDVICFLRDQFTECGPAANARALLHTLEEAYAAEGGRKYLYHLFPHGPVTQGCELAGLPVPPGNFDRSFGTVH